VHKTNGSPKIVIKSSLGNASEKIIQDGKKMLEVFADFLREFLFLFDLLIVF
jgi:hypothetical protein